MNMQMKKQSKRFVPAKWAEWLVPAILVILGLALLFAIGLVIAASLGVRL